MLLLLAVCLLQYLAFYITAVTADRTPSQWASFGISVSQKCSAVSVLSMAQQGLSLAELRERVPELHENIHPEVIDDVEAEARYLPFLSNQKKEISQLRKTISLSVLDYSAVPGLSVSDLEKLQSVRPATVGMAAAANVTVAGQMLLLAHSRKLLQSRT